MKKLTISLIFVACALLTAKAQQSKEEGITIPRIDILALNAWDIGPADGGDATGGTPDIRAAHDRIGAPGDENSRENECSARQLRVNSTDSTNGAGGENVLDSKKITGPEAICSKETYKIEDLPSGTSIAWSCTENIALVSKRKNEATFKWVKNGEGAITAVLTYKDLTKELKISIKSEGNPPVDFAFYDNYRNYQVSTGSSYGTYTVKPEDNPSAAQSNNYWWTVKGPKTDELYSFYEYYGHEFPFTPSKQGFYAFTLKRKGLCGWSEPKRKTFFCKDIERP